MQRIRNQRWYYKHYVDDLDEQKNWRWSFQNKKGNACRALAS